MPFLNESLTSQATYPCRTKFVSRAWRAIRPSKALLLWKIKLRSPLCYVRTASYFVDTFLTGKIKHPAHATTVKKSNIHITETKDNRCRLLPLNLRSGTYNVEDLGECKKDKTILLP